MTKVQYGANSNVTSNSIHVSILADRRLILKTCQYLPLPRPLELEINFRISQSKHKLWDLLKYRFNETVLLSTSNKFLTGGYENIYTFTPTFLYVDLPTTVYTPAKTRNISIDKCFFPANCLLNNNATSVYL